MKLNLHILMEALLPYGFQGILQNDPCVRNCAYPTICYQLPAKFSANKLYILHADILPEVCHTSRDISLLVLGKPSDSWLSACDLLYSDTAPSAEILIDILHEEFSRYDMWEQEIIDEFKKGRSYQQITNLSGPLFHNPIEAWQESVYLLSQYTPKMNPPSQKYLDFQKYSHRQPGFIMSEDEFQLLITDSTYLETFNDTTPQIFAGEQQGFRTLYYNVFIENKLVVRVCMSEIITPITSRDIALIKIFGDFFLLGLDKYKGYNAFNDSEHESLMLGMLQHKMQPESKIFHMLLTKGWDLHDDYIIVVISLKITVKKPEYTLRPFADEFLQRIFESAKVIYKDHIVAIINLTKLCRSREQLYHQMVPYLRDSLMCAGISVTFQDFRELYSYYCQASMALKVGSKYTPSHWYFKFEDYQFYYLLEQYTGKLKPEALIPRELHILQEYDNLHNTFLVQTLEKYLDCNCSCPDAANLLYIHRNTMIYRINKITELTKLDFTNPEKRILLTLALKLKAIS